MAATTRLSQASFLLLLMAFALFAYPVVAYWAFNAWQLGWPSYPKQAYVQVYGSGPALVGIGLLALRFHRPILAMASLGLGTYWLGAICYELCTKG